MAGYYSEWTCVNSGCMYTCSVQPAWAAVALWMHACCIKKKETERFELPVYCHGVRSLPYGLPGPIIGIVGIGMLCTQQGTVWRWWMAGLSVYTTRYIIPPKS